MELVLLQQELAIHKDGTKVLAFMGGPSSIKNFVRLPRAGIAAC
jgi:hypothetical protein